MTNHTASITIIHNMNTQRITISIPKYLYDDLVRQLPPRKISGFVASALEKELINQESDPIDEFIKLRKTLPKIKRLNILKAIEKGRR